jgi:hypothetical protein
VFNQAELIAVNFRYYYVNGFQIRQEKNEEEIDLGIYCLDLRLERLRKSPEPQRGSASTNATEFVH